MDTRFSILDSRKNKEKFQCQGCGNCCRVEGYVHLSNDEIDLISKYLNISKETFIDLYTRLASNRQGLSLIEKEDSSCILLDNNKCIIYPVRPWQCRTFPIDWQVSGIDRFCRVFL